MGGRNVAGMLTLLRFIVSVLVHRFRRRAVLELENLALRHQLHVLRRQRPGRPRLFAIDRLLWVWLYRLWPRCLNARVLVKAVTVVHSHCQGSPYDSSFFWLRSLGCRRLQIAKFPIFFLPNRQQSASKKEGL